MKSAALSVIFFLFVIGLHAQTRVIHGNLRVFNTYPVKNIVITSKKAGATSISDSLGHFSIVCKEKDVIKVNSVAFKPARKKVFADTRTVSMELQFIDSKKNREIAVGYGYINEKDLSFGVSHMENDHDKFCSYTNIYDLLRGELSGVSVQGRNVYIRGGTNSINLPTTALFVVDDQTTNNIDWVHPCQVKSISVIKDGNTAVYGARGGNGVILIELVK
jgi:TonB-dependent SusC/RagA subfamily outer membrane receptor